MEFYKNAVRINKKYIKHIFNTPDDIGNWFGYYNYDVMNSDQTKMLCQKVSSEARVITSDMKIECGYYNVSSGKWFHIGFSDSYNWPQGCMLQWMKGTENKNKVIYNCSKNGHLVSVIHDISEIEDDRIINWSIYGLAPDGNKSIALNMERSYWCRAYHYYSVCNKLYDVRIADDDGIFEIDLKQNTRRRIVDIHDVIETDKEPYFDNAKHWLEHIMISPNGKRFCFYHRFTVSDLDSYETRVFIADIDGKNLQMIDGWRKFYWSHFGWNGDSSFTIYAYEQKEKSRSLKIRKRNTQGGIKRKKRNLKSVIRAIYKYLPIRFRHYVNTLRLKSYYQYYTVNDDNIVKQVDKFNNRQFTTDGHPSFTNDGLYMITGTYPDEYNKRHLYVFNIKTKKIAEILQVDEISNLDHYPCDLHPKLCNDNRLLAIDIFYNSKHHMMLLELDWDSISAKIG